MICRESEERDSIILQIIKKGAFMQPDIVCYTVAFLCGHDIKNTGVQIPLQHFDSRAKEEEHRKKRFEVLVQSALFSVCCMHSYCNWHGRDYLKITTMGTMCSDCMFCFIHELKGLMY